MNKSDIRRVASDTKRDEEVMSNAVDQASFYLNELTRMQHRGRGDTWSAARDRVARIVGIKREYAKRIWQRCQSMQDVSGEALLRLQRAYVAACEKNEAAAAEYRAEREALTRARNAVAQRSDQPGD